MILCSDYATEKQTKHDRETIPHGKYLQRIDVKRNFLFGLVAPFVRLETLQFPTGASGVA